MYSPQSHTLPLQYTWYVEDSGEQHQSECRTVLNCIKSPNVYHHTYRDWWTCCTYPSIAESLTIRNLLRWAFIGNDTFSSLLPKERLCLSVSTEVVSTKKGALVRAKC